MTDRERSATEQQQPAAPEVTEHRERPSSAAFKKFIASGWTPRPTGLPDRSPAAPYAAERRAALAAQFPGERLVVPAGALRVRSNDTDHRFRPHSAFAHLTGLGTDREPDAVLVLEPRSARSGDPVDRAGNAPADQAGNDGGPAGNDGGPAGGHDAVLFFRPRSGRDVEEFYADTRNGELWVGVRPSLEEIAAETGLVVRHLDELAEALGKDAGTGPGSVTLRLVRGADPRVEAIVAALRPDLDAQDATGAQEATGQAGPETTEQAGREATATPQVQDAELARALSELRLVKDEWEVGQLRLAVEVTARGFADIVRSLRDAVHHPRGERVIETAFESRARQEGNGIGYDTIAAAGPHACTLHWIRNDGLVNAGDLVLVDAGVEVDSLYTADVTRTLPVSGRFTPAQARVYQAVLDAADAAFAVARPGTRFRDVHRAAMAVIATRLHAWGLLPAGVDVETTLDPEGQFHRRWMVHGTSHHLGLDVHDCAQARREMYLDAELRPGMVFTIEPGLYFTVDDLLVPEELRGIGVRIEDDVLVTEDGCENLSALLPRTVPQVEAWMAALLRPPTGRG
jgi:Xaa-Pro aminopeptidase